MNLLKIRLLFLSFMIVPFCSASHAPSALEFKHAVVRYIKHTDMHCLQHVQRNGDENVSYKKELRYLFKNHNTISTSALLSRLCSAHQEMVKIETDINSDTFKKYEQISSALLLICAQSFFYDARNQILNALDEIDHLMIYWRYQQHHQVRYFFSKSPHKWVIGQSQAKEIANNVIKLERKQRELYNMLGALAGHAHALISCNIHYDDCYTWVSGLLAVLPYNLAENAEHIEFDVVAGQLALRIKKVDSLNHDLLRSVASVRKPSHFVQHWIAYTTMIAAAGYIGHKYAHNYDEINSNVRDRLLSLSRSWKELVVGPMKDIWNTLSGKDDVSMIQETVDFEKTIHDFAQDIKDLETKKDVNKATSDALVEYLKHDHKNTQDLMVSLLNKQVSEGKITQELCDEIIAAEQIGDVTKFQKFTFNMSKYLYGDLIQSDDLINAIIVLAELKIYHYGSSLIQVVFELIVDYGIRVIKEVLIVLAKGNKEWAAVCKKVNLILNVAVLTPTIIVSGAGSYGLCKTYKWMTAHDYSPIRIALADVNSLLIESGAQLDNYAYGKLLYLVFKLRHRADSLKDPLAHEFLADVAKLESKQYGSDAKHSIIENMFNKYAFLGRIAV